MKKIISLVMFLAFININAYEINFNKTFNKKVSPDTLITQVYIDVTKKDETKVAKTLDKFTNFFKKTKNVELKNGRYSISPRYKYKKDETIFVGYNGSLDYTVKSTNAKELNNFISKLISKKNKINSDDVKLQISNINWQVSQKLYDESANTLRVKSILWANSYADFLSKKLNTTCKLKNININSNARNVGYYRNAPVSFKTKSASFKSAVTPIKSDESININSNFTLECK